MRYYHDSDKRIVYREHEPSIAQDGKLWRAVVEVEIVDARNYRKVDGLWAKGWRTFIDDTYSSRIDAERIFRPMHMEHWGEQISQEEYDRLAAQYKAEAQANRPPSQ
jgi:hypothetical protein